MKLDSSIVGLGMVVALGLAAPTTAAAQEVCTTGTWTSVAPLNTARSRLGMAYLASTGKFYVAGGEGSGGRNNPIEEYDPSANTWTNRANLSVGVSNTGAVGAGNYVYIPGGYDDSAVISNVMQRFDPIANTVVQMAPMPTANAAHAVTTLNGKIYVLGGSSAALEGTTNLIYDIASNSWASGAAVPTAVHYPAVTTDGTLLYLLGGNTSNLSITQIYNPLTNTWTTGTPMSTGRGGGAAFHDGARIWAVGGGWASYLPATEYWNGSAWSSAPSMNTGARTLGAAYGGGIALKAGGWNGNYVNAAETLSVDCETPPPTCADEGYTGTKLTWCKNICENGLTGAALDSWIHRWINRYRDLPYCAQEGGGEEEPPPQES